MPKTSETKDTNRQNSRFAPLKFPLFFSEIRAVPAPVLRLFILDIDIGGSYSGLLGHRVADGRRKLVIDGVGRYV